jgi:flagellar biogenesis protein FliO
VARIFPIIILIVLLSIGGIYWATTFDHVQTTTTMDNNSTMKTGYDMTMMIAGFTNNMWAILAFVLVLILIVVVLGRAGGD